MYTKKVIDPMTNWWQTLLQLLNYQIERSQAESIILGIVILLTSFLFLSTVKQLARRRIETIKNHRVHQTLTQNLRNLNSVFFWAVAVRLSIPYFHAESELTSLLTRGTNLVLAFFLVVIAQEWAVFFIQSLIQKNQPKRSKFDPGALTFLDTLVRVVMWLLAVILVLQNFNYNVSALIASLGIGGIAIAFALQNILGDIFASFSIYLDKPFQVGDFIEAGLDKGEVTKIGLRTTRLKSITGEELVIPNKDLTNTRIHNYSEFKKRRVEFNFYLSLDNSQEKLSQVPELLQEIIEGQEHTTFVWTVLKNVSELWLVYEVVYFINSGDYALFMKTRSSINLEMLATFKKQGLKVHGGE